MRAPPLAVAVCLAAAAASAAWAQTQGPGDGNGDATAAERPLAVRLSPIVPGAEPMPLGSEVGERYAGDPEAVAAGEQLYLALNCVGCHFHGGGGMGPPLMDEEWIYGSSIENIVSTLREGRPKGMPAYRGFVPDEQLWLVAAYVRSLGERAEGR